MKSDIGDSRPRPRWKQWLIQTLDLTSQSREDLMEDLQRANEKNLLPGETVGMLQGVLEFGALQVRDIMVPRSQINFIYHEDDFSKILQRIAATEHSRYPVVDEDRDDLVGILLAKDLLKYIGREAEFKIDDIIRPALIIPESQRLSRLLTEFRNSRNHMAVVIDEYSGISGLVTFEDVLEQIVGEIDDEHDDEEDETTQVVAQDDGRFIVEATTPIDEFNDIVGTNFDTDEFDTIAGIVINKLGKIPRQGDELVLEGWLFRVLRSDNRRILSLEVLPHTESSSLAATPAL
ncbi:MULTISPECIES: transporter associated domain-containing protein [Thiothrix]|uniref:Magnesium and cobalt efflux protein CorC n=1 Tax=Thiothrix unzii TaxID=111769 RepID=A0A975FBN7_9GAMM|nr:MULTISPECIES: transporter associated domain-containing protein [Thiothrix]MDX9988031.1 transporter associated domain-containing protein [Thiothrix unzii]QTR54539.1 CBS domain-containing protein [Thiothrix unzii]